MPGGAFLVTCVSCAAARATPMLLSFAISALDLDLYRLGRDEKNDVRGIGLAELHRLCSVGEHRHRGEEDVDAA